MSDPLPYRALVGDCSVYRGAVYQSISLHARMDLRDVFTTNLPRLRNARKLSQDDLAYEAEVSPSYLSQLEKGAFYASLKIVGRLATALESPHHRCSARARNRPGWTKPACIRWTKPPCARASLRSSKIE
jgi:DNA-binding XRE family transcriptional regulator